MLLPKNPLESIERKLKQHQRLLKVAAWALDELKQFLKDSGGCDHSVGICWCDYIRNIEELDEAIRAASIPLNNREE